MSVNPTSDFSYLLPTNGVYPPGEFSGSLSSETQKNIFTTIMNEGRGAILQNPVSGVLDSFSTNLTQIYDTVINSPCLSGGEQTILIDAIGTPSGTSGLIEQISLFRTHTDILSGVIPQGNNPTPGLDRVLSVGRSLGNLSYAVDSAADCFSLLNNMTGLFSNDLINGYIREITNMIAQINGCLADVNAIASRINEIASILQSIIDADNNFFQDALNRLIQASLASLLENMYQNPCGKFLLESKIGQSKLLNYLR